MRNSLIAKLLSCFLLYPLIINSALSKNIDNKSLGTQLEAMLNQEKHDSLKDLFLQQSFKQFNKQYLDFKKNYKNKKWSIKTTNNHLNKTFLDIKITSTKKIGAQIYNLTSNQTVRIETYRDKIKSYEVTHEESILHSQDSPLIVKIIAPDRVLTGERYEIDLIIERPLDNSLIASGLIILENNDKTNITNHTYDLIPNQSGGLFKYIKAPLEPGFQTISAIITHPEGIYLITKKIKVGL